MTQWRKVLMAILPALMLLFMASPSLVMAADDDGDAHAAETDSHGEDAAADDHSSESGEMMEASAGAGTGIALSLLVLVLTIVMLVVVVVGVSISIIGGGYLSSQSD